VVPSVALSFAIAGLVPEVYESTALLEVSATGSSGQDGLEASAEVRKVLFEPARLQSLGAAIGAPDEAPARILEQIGIRPRSAKTLELSFRAESPETAQRACTKLTASVVTHFGTAPPPEDEHAAEAALDRATKELTDFAVAHPTVVSAPATSASVRPAASDDRPGATDPAISVLRQEKARLEVELAHAQSEPQPGSQNPYDDPAPRPEVETLKKRITEIKNAILAHQAVATKKNDVAPKPDAAPADLEDRWRKLVQAVADAQHAVAIAPKTAAPATFARVVEPPSLPIEPVTLRRALVRVFGTLLGVALGLALPFARRLRPKPAAARRDSASKRPPEKAAASEKTPEKPDGPNAAASTGAEAPAPATSSDRAPAAEPATPEKAAPREAIAFDKTVVATNTVALTGNVVIPRPPAVPSFAASGTTQIGMVDPAVVGRAVSGSESAGARLEGRPIVDVTAERASPVPRAQELQGSKAGPSPPPGPPNATVRREAAWSAVPAERTSAPPPTPPDATRRLDASLTPEEGTAPITQRLGSPRPTASSAPDDRGGAPREDALAVYRSDTTYSYVDKSWRPRARRESERVEARPSHRPSPEQNAFERLEARRHSDRPEPFRRPVSPMPPPRTASDRPPPHGHPRSDPPRPERRSDPPRPERRSDPPRPERRSDPPRPERRSDPPRQDRRSEPPRHDRRSEAPANPQGYRSSATRPGWASPASPLPPAALAVPERASPEMESDEQVVVTRSAPPSWRLGAALAAPETQQGELGVLRGQLLELSRRYRCFVVGVTSEPSLALEKSYLAARIAASVAADGRARVLLLEANFDYPAVHRLLSVDMPAAGGFSQQMRARIRTGTKKPWTVVQCSPTFHVLAEGIVRSPGIAFSQQFSEAVNELRNYYDVIVADGPVVGFGVDHKPLDAVADGLVLAVEPKAPLNPALDQAHKLFGKKELVAALAAEAPPA
jgi:hypothetical protein